MIDYRRFLKAVNPGVTTSTPHGESTNVGGTPEDGTAETFKFPSIVRTVLVSDFIPSGTASVGDGGSVEGSLFNDTAQTPGMVDSINTNYASIYIDGLKCEPGNLEHNAMNRTLFRKYNGIETYCWICAGISFRGQDNSSTAFSASARFEYELAAAAGTWGPSNETWRGNPFSYMYEDATYTAGTTYGSMQARAELIIPTSEWNPMSDYRFRWTHVQNTNLEASLFLQNSGYVQVVEFIPLETQYPNKGNDPFA